MVIERPEIPQPDTQSENEIAISAPIKKFTFYCKFLNFDRSESSFSLSLC